MLWGSLDDYRFLGVDESRHGRPDEIFVGVYSDNPFLLMPETLGKRRGDNTSIEDETRQGDTFRYVRFNGAFRDNFSDNDLKVIALAELINQGNSLERVIFDGRLPVAHERALTSLFEPTEFPELATYVRADTTYPIVNMADRIANLMGKRRSGRYKINGYNDLQIFPKIDFYKKVLIKGEFAKLESKVCPLQPLG